MKSELGAAWPVFWTISLVFDSHPPNGIRDAALEWESNFVGSFPKGSHADASAFNAMKNRLKFLDAQDAEKARKAREAADAKKKQQQFQTREGDSRECTEIKKIKKACCN